MLGAVTVEWGAWPEEVVKAARNASTSAALADVYTVNSEVGENRVSVTFGRSMGSRAFFEAVLHIKGPEKDTSILLTDTSFLSLLDEIDRHVERNTQMYATDLHEVLAANPMKEPPKWPLEDPDEVSPDNVGGEMQGVWILSSVAFEEREGRWVWPGEEPAGTPVGAYGVKSDAIAAMNTRVLEQGRIESDFYHYFWDSLEWEDWFDTHTKALREFYDAWVQERETDEDVQDPPASFKEWRDEWSDDDFPADLSPQTLQLIAPTAAVIFYSLKWVPYA